MSNGTVANAPALIRKLEEKLARFHELRDAMNDSATMSNAQRLIAISKEAGQLEPVAQELRPARDLDHLKSRHVSHP